MILKARKKPIDIECIKWDGLNLTEIKKFCGKIKNAYNSACTNDIAYVVYRNDYKYDLYISTLEGDMKAEIGDYIIKGVNGEFYPCKSDIFEKTYEILK